MLLTRPQVIRRENNLIACDAAPRRRDLPIQASPFDALCRCVIEKVRASDLRRLGQGRQGAAYLDHRSRKLCLTDDVPEHRKPRNGTPCKEDAHDYRLSFPPGLLRFRNRPDLTLLRRMRPSFQTP